MTTPDYLKSSKPSLIQVGLGVVVGLKGVLIARRPDSARLGGLWEFPGGKIQADETPEACVVRELDEELGLRVEPIAPLARLGHEYDYGSVDLHVYWCRLAGVEEQTPQPLGADEWRWIAPAEVQDYPFPPANGPLLAAVADPQAWPADVAGLLRGMHRG